MQTDHVALRIIHKGNKAILPNGKFLYKDTAPIGGSPVCLNGAVGTNPYRSNGKVATWGPSALGRVQYETARSNPPNLVCAVPMVMALNLDPAPKVAAA